MNGTIHVECMYCSPSATLINALTSLWRHFSTKNFQNKIKPSARVYAEDDEPRFISIFSTFKVGLFDMAVPSLPPPHPPIGDLGWGGGGGD
jgi:hypothetical protein